MKLFYKELSLNVQNLFLDKNIDCIHESKLTKLDKDYYYYIDYYSGKKSNGWDYPLEKFCLQYFNEFKLSVDIKSTLRFNLSRDILIDEAKIDLAIPNLVYQALRSGNARLIIDTSKEGHVDLGSYHIHQIFNVPEEQVVWMAGDRLIKHRIKDHHSKHIISVFNFWEAFVAQSPLSELDKETIVNTITNKTVKKYYNTFYNKKSRSHRLGLMIELHHKNMLDDMIWSWAGFKMEGQFPPDPDYIMKFSDDYKDSIDAILSWDRLKNYKKQEVSDHMIHPEFTLDDVHNTYYNLVTETTDFNDSMFLTEKTYKAMLLFQPFLIWGSPYSIQTLRASGYKAFDKWINHSYDLIEDHDGRRLAIVDEVKRLNSISKEVWAEMCFEMLPDLNYNYNHLMNHSSRYTIDEHFQITYKNTA